MERAAWTEERLDDLLESIRNGFTRTDQDVRDLRAETRNEFSELRTEMRSGFSELRAEMRSEFADVQGEIATLRGEIDALRLTLFRVGGAGFLGIIAAILARGV
jgi:chromosome segregation ATPase